MNTNNSQTTRNKIVIVIILTTPILLFIYNNWYLDQKLEVNHIYLYFSLYTICLVALYNNCHIYSFKDYTHQLLKKELWALFIISELCLYRFFSDLSTYDLFRFQLSFLLSHINVLTFLFFVSSQNNKKTYEIFYSSLIFICNIQMYSFLIKNEYSMKLLAWTPINLVHLNTFFNPSLLSIFISLISLLYFYAISKFKE